jgi:hypothetical protein
VVLLVSDRKDVAPAPSPLIAYAKDLDAAIDRVMSGYSPSLIENTECRRRPESAAGLPITIHRNFVVNRHGEGSGVTFDATIAEHSEIILSFDGRVRLSAFDLLSGYLSGGDPETAVERAYDELDAALDQVRTPRVG